MTDGLGQCGERGHLGDDVNVGVRIRLPSFAFDDPARLAAARGVTGARHRIAELAVGILRVLCEWAVGEALLVAEFSPDKD